MKQTQRTRVTMTKALVALGFAGALSQATGAELFPYNPPGVAPGQQQARPAERPSAPGSLGASGSSQFYGDFAARVKKLTPAEKTKLRSVLYEQLNGAVQRGDFVQAEYYSNLIKYAGF